MSNKIELIITRSVKLMIAAWFIFSWSGQSITDEARLISHKAYATAEECAEVARLLQAGRLTPFYYCVGSEKVRELPPLREQPFKFSVDGDNKGMLK